jgi:FAD/FMN-containing dehydrogenase
MTVTAAIDADTLRTSFRGEVLTPSDPGYDERRRVWNGSIDKRPGVIARCTGQADVISAVRFARDRELLVAVRGGGHSFPGLSVCDDGMLIDLSPMKGIRVDPSGRTVRAQAGVLLGELDRETQAFGLAAPSGIVTHTGIAGLTLGGGIGWVHRKYGLTIDNLLSVDVITADGEFVTASEDANADLFWGIRGGGGNFGIVTSFEYALHAIGPEVLAGPVFWHAADAPDVLRFYRDYITTVPDDYMSLVVLRQAPALPIVPQELVGKPVVGVVSCWCGDLDEGEKVLRPLKTFGSPVLDACVAKPFVVHQASLDPSFVPGWHYYVRSCDVAELSDPVIDVTAEYATRITSPVTSLALWQMGGAVARVGEDDTAFNGRGAGHTFNINGNAYTADGFEEQREWARSFWTALAPYHTGVYVNFLGPDEDRVREAYGAAKYERLKALKNAYDPTNFFRLNQNIKPD